MEVIQEADEQTAAAPAYAPPMIDEDGFETITKGRKGRGKPK